MLKLKDILLKVQPYISPANIDLIKKAYVFSAKAHEGQVRKSGDPYLVHPLEVANILADMKLDAPSIAAAILHDTIEDTSATKEEIEGIFGKEIAELVDGVTKLSKLHFHTKEERQAENFRKMIVAMSKDVRVILIKLADRLNNMRTLHFMPEEKQMSIAQETLDVYAPLANRFGIQWMKIALEDLGFRFSKPDLYRQIEKKMTRLKKNREEYIEKVEKEILNHFKDSIPQFEIAGRLKHPYGIYQKMERQNITFEQVHDLIAFRILTRNVEECYEALGLLHSLWKPIPGRFKDYIAMPKANGYQSLHTSVVCIDAERVEFQIRTFKMHEVAEKGIAAHWHYKENGQLDLEDQSTFNWIRQMLDWQREINDSLEFMDTLKLDLFPSDVFVFTPKGAVKALPYGATPIDFAYSIHSDVGNHCAGAKVNGRITPLETKLESGDTVEVLTSDKKKPTKDWLKMAATSRAKARIRQFLKQEQKEKSIHMGKNLFEEECRKYAIEPAIVLNEGAFHDYTRKKGLQGESNFYSAIAYGRVSLPVLFSHLYPGKAPTGETKEGLISKIFRKVTQKNRDLVSVDGLDDVLVTFAKCCSPVPGDPIVGFISRGRGVTVHRTDCSKVPSIDPLRRVTTTWNMKAEVIRTAKLKISCENKTGMLAQITKEISDRKVNISMVIVRTTQDEKALILLDVGVKNVMEINRITKALERIEGVIRVERVCS